MTIGRQLSVNYWLLDFMNRKLSDKTSFEDTELVIKRALSCDSVCSDTSVALGDLETFNITGYLCIGLEYDR